MKYTLEIILYTEFKIHLFRIFNIKKKIFMFRKCQKE